MKNTLSKLIKIIQKLPEECLDEVMEFTAMKAEESKGTKPVLPCPHCKETRVTRFGKKRGRQRYRCKGCGKTFVETTNTVMYHSHSGEAVWKQVLSDTIEGVPIAETASCMEISESTAFRMRHKILLSLESEEGREPTVLGGVCELDDTYVLESLKGTKISDDYWRKPRKHGAKAQKRGISNEYISICTGVERKGKAISETVTRATPRKEDITSVFGTRIEESALILCDGSGSYNVLSKIEGCVVKNIFDEEGSGAGGKGFYNINTINSFHSFIKSRYNQYRGVATHYLNRYNKLFSNVFRCADELVNKLWRTLSSNDTKRFYSVNDVRTMNLLRI
jgi:transposase-like protein